MKKFLVLFIFLPNLVFSQVQLFVMELPDTLYPNRTYPFQILITKKGLKSYTQLTIPKIPGVILSDFSQQAEIYPNYYLINWIPLPEGDLNVYVNLKIMNDKRPAHLDLNFIFTYFVLGNVGQLNYVMRYKLSDKSFYVLEFQGVR